MLRPEFVQRKLQLIAEDLGRLLQYKDESWESIIADFLRLAALERLLERIVMRAIDINEHLHPGARLQRCRPPHRLRLRPAMP